MSCEVLYTVSTTSNMCAKLKKTYKTPSHPIPSQRTEFRQILLEHTQQSEEVMLHFDDDQPRSLTPHQL